MFALVVLFFAAGFVQAADLANATVTVVVQDESGNPLHLTWPMPRTRSAPMPSATYAPARVTRNSYSVDPERAADCRSVRVSMDPYDSRETCVSSALMTGIRIDGRTPGSAASTTYRSTSADPETFEVDPAAPSVLYLTALPGLRTVEFPEEIHLAEGDFSPVNAMESWDVAPGKVYILTVRPVSRVSFQDTVRSGGRYVLTQGGRAVEVKDGMAVRPGDYVISWFPDEYAWTRLPECELRADGSLPAGIPVKMYEKQIPVENRHCAAEEHILVYVDEADSVRWKKGTDPSVPPSEPAFRTYVNGQMVGSGDTVRVEPGKDLKIEVRTTSANGK